MADNKTRSFTATLQIAESPVNSLDCLCTGPVSLVTPTEVPGYAIEGAHALGMLNGTEDDWQHGQGFGLIPFDKGDDQCAMLLYFRYSDAGYRLYVRSGPYFGKGIFTTAEGLVAAQAIEAQDPSLWTLVDAQTGAPFDLAQLEDDRREIQMIARNGHPMEIHNLYPVGGFLACYAAAQQCTLSLLIAQRGVDWLNA
jgi:hypothetical protein